MAKKKPPGRPKSGNARVMMGYRYSQAMLDDLAELVACCRSEAPPYLEISERLVIEAVVHHPADDVVIWALALVEQGQLALERA